MRAPLPCVGDVSCRSPSKLSLIHRACSLLNEVVTYVCGPVHFYIVFRQLLMASGIGDKAELQAHGVECMADIPELGKNLQVRRPYKPCRDERVYLMCSLFGKCTRLSSCDSRPLYYYCILRQVLCTAHWVAMCSARK